MLLLSLLIIPIIGLSVIYTGMYDEPSSSNIKHIKIIGLITSIVNLFISLLMFIFFDFSSNQFQFVQEYHSISSFDFYLGVDGLSIYFVLLTTIIMPVALLSNWTSISENVRSYVIIILLLESLLLANFLVLDILLFYIFFESILPPLFILIGLFGSKNRTRASFYLFLYTLFGSLFLLLSILTIYSIMGTTDFSALFKTNFYYYTQIFIFIGIFISIAVKTPLYFLNIWLLKAHVESPLSGSIILAAIVLKLSLYAVIRLILPMLPQASLDLTYIVYLLGVITILFASFSTIRTTDVKELIAYSSVAHAAVYLIGVFSNTIQGIEGSIVLGLAHGLVSSGLFICAGGVLYDRTHTRLITYYRGIAQIMPVFSVIFFILCLGNAGTPLTLNFVGEFMSLYGAFERLPLLGALASSSIIFSAAYTMFMFNRIVFGGSLSRHFSSSIADVNRREFFILLPLVTLTVLFGIYPSPILDGLHYSVSTLIYSTDSSSYMYMGLLPLIHIKKVNTQAKSAEVPSNSKLDPWYLTGFTDGEGSFSISIREFPNFKAGWKVEPRFTIGLHKRDLPLLKLIQYTFGGIGTISSQGSGAYSWRVSSLNDLVKVIIPHFDKYPLMTQKRADFELFKRVVDLISRQEHFTLKGIQLIVNLKAAINNGISDKLKLAFPNTKIVTRPIFPLSSIPDGNWLCGFVEGEGNFMVMVKKNLSHKSGVQVILRFKVSQHSRDADMIKSLVGFFGCGGYYSRADFGEYIVTGFSDITNVILPFFNKYPLLGCKALDLADFSIVANMMQNKDHLTEEGLETIRKIKEGMNKGRK